MKKLNIGQGQNLLNSLINMGLKKVTPMDGEDFLRGGNTQI